MDSSGNLLDEQGSVIRRDELTYDHASVPITPPKRVDEARGITNFEDVVAGVEGAEPFPGLREAWRWSPMPRFVFSLALDSKRDSAYQLNTIDHFDQKLVTAVLEFAREQRLAEEVRDTKPFTIAPGFATESYGFDVVVAVPSAVHQYHFGRDNALGERVTGVFPAYSCEFSGHETLEEAVHRFKRMLRPTVVERPAVPYLRMRYENTRTGGDSRGASRPLTYCSESWRFWRVLRVASWSGRTSAARCGMSPGTALGSSTGTS
ncbi:hypothetical protein [Streptomyces scopuliridis]|uniref:hypothetical protein n=1 Tax=Streptomyces scopuliridis TaxID=452529 RepID=UPI0036C07393